MKTVGDRMIVKPDPEIKQTSGGLELAKAQPSRTGQALACGPDCKTATEGCKVLFAKACGVEIEYNGEKVIVMREADIFAVI